MSLPAFLISIASMCKQIGIVIALLMFCGSVKARIGETEAQITARYGQSIGDIPTETFGAVRGFALPGFVVGVKLMNGTSAMEMLSKNDQSETNPSEIEALLKKHGADMPWKVDRFDKPDWKRWRTQDGSLVAVYDERRHFLYVNSKQFYEQQGERAQKTGQ
jgi:hypothetical protein